MKIQIRPYQTEDTAAILEIINHTIAHSTALYDYTPRTIAQQQSMLDEKITKGFPIVVAVESDKVVGFGYYGEFRYREAYKHTVEHSVYVHHDCIGKGIGQLLMQSLLESAKQQKVHTMIGVIDSENKGSIAFHERFGFKSMGVLEQVAYKFDRWLDVVIMQRMI